MTYNKAISDMVNNRWEKNVAGQIKFWREGLGDDAADANKLAEFNAWVKAEGLEDGLVTDAINPTYYDFPGGVQVRDISAHLTSFGGQALQYVARATRLDGNNKGEAVKDLRKALDFIGWEIERLEAGSD